MVYSSLEEENTICFCCSSKFSSAHRTASTTKAVKVQSLPWIWASTCSITSLGKRMLLLVVGGTAGF